MIASPLLDGPQIPSRWAARYASVLSDDPGSAVLTLTCWGMVERCRPGDLDASQVVGMWKDPNRGVRAIPLEPGAQGVLLTGCASNAIRRSNDGRRPVENAIDFFDVGLHQITAATSGSMQTPAARPPPTRPPMDVDDVTVLTGWAEAVAESLAFAPAKLEAVFNDARSGAQWRAVLGLDEPSDRLRRAIDSIRQVLVSATADNKQPTLDGVLAALGKARQDEPLSVAHRVLQAVLEQRRSARERDDDRHRAAGRR
jgi:hypothetical protein